MSELSRHGNDYVLHYIQCKLVTVNLARFSLGYGSTHVACGRLAMSDLSELAAFVQQLAVTQAAFEAYSSEKSVIFREILAENFVVSKSANLADVYPCPH